MLAPVQARALGLDPNADRNDSENGSVPPLGAGFGGPNSASPTTLNFPSNAAITGNALLNSSGGGNPFMTLQGASNALASTNNKRSKKPVKQHTQNSDSELDEDEEGEEGREAEKAAFALESIAVAGRPSAVSFRYFSCVLTRFREGDNILSRPAFP